MIRVRLRRVYNLFPATPTKLTALEMTAVQCPMSLGAKDNDAFPNFVHDNKASNQLLNMLQNNDTIKLNHIE